MGFLDTFKGRQYKEESEALRNRVQELESMLTPEMRSVDSLAQQARELTAKRDSLQKTVDELSRRDEELDHAIAKKMMDVISLDDARDLQEFGLYTPHFKFETVDQYKDELSHVREKEKREIVRINNDAKKSNWQVNGSVRKGRQMVGQTTRLLMRAYNAECDSLVSKVKFSNIDRTVDNIRKMAYTINRQGTVMGIEIPDSYVELKVKEAYIAYEYARFKQEEKERISEERARQREEAKLAKEIAEERKKLEKERKQYKGALQAVLEQLKHADPEKKADLEAKRKELESHLSDVDKAFADVDYREANQRAGFVYVISNIGSFGDGVYKIGMTRRLDPLERIRELSDASVPFNFDVHAMIFSDDAPALEAALHHEFENRKVNLVNGRREFFRVSLDEIKRVVKENYDKTVEFVDVPDAEQYRVSLKIAERINRDTRA
jgi:predicted transport protein